MKKLSIIIPMYNVENFIERCLLSLVNQDISEDEFEIICVNDGSPDKSASIVELFQKDYDNIVLINQENQGVSCARNKGIDFAHGKFILFIDPDDYVQKNTFARVVREAEYSGAQVFL